MGGHHECNTSLEEKAVSWLTVHISSKPHREVHQVQRNVSHKKRGFTNSRLPGHQVTDPLERSLAKKVCVVELACKAC